MYTPRMNYSEGYLAGMIDREAGDFHKIPMSDYTRDYAQGYHDGAQDLPERDDTPNNPWKR